MYWFNSLWPRGSASVFGHASSLQPERLTQVKSQLAPPEPNTQVTSAAEAAEAAKIGSI